VFRAPFTQFCRAERFVQVRYVCETLRSAGWFLKVIARGRKQARVADQLSARLERG